MRMKEHNMENEKDVKPQKAEIVPAAPLGAMPPGEAEQEIMEGAVTPFEGDFMEVTVDVAKHLAEYEKAVDTIINFIIRRTYDGDWVSHARKGTPDSDRVANMSGAAAERIARDLGITELNRTQPVKTMNEKYPGHYAYKCEGDFSFRGRKVHAIGIANTRNPFHFKAGGYERKPEDIREEYIIQEAWRDCTKQGVKGLFGLRNIPLLKLKSLGYDISKVDRVDYGEGEGTAGRRAAAETEIKQYQVKVVLKDHHARLTKDGKPYQDFADEKGKIYSLWRPLENMDVQRLLTALANNELCVMDVRDNGKYVNIDKVVEVVPM